MLALSKLDNGRPVYARATASLHAGVRFYMHDDHAIEKFATCELDSWHVLYTGYDSTYRSRI